MDVSKIMVIVQKFDFILDNDAKANSVPKKTKVGVLYLKYFMNKDSELCLLLWYFYGGGMISFIVSLHP